MKYLVTGAAGAFGSRAIQTLTQKVPSNEIIAGVTDMSKAKNLMDAGTKARIGLSGRKFVLRRSVARFRGNLSGLLSSGDAFHIQHWNDGGRSRSEHEGREYCCQRFVFSHVDLLRGHSPIRGDADSIAEDCRYSTADSGDQIAESGFSGLTDRSCLAPSGCHGGSDYYLRRNCGEILQVGIK